MTQSTDAMIEAGCPPHCCCCGVGEPCCDCGMVRPSASCIGEICFCGQPAAKKIGEEILHDDPMPNRHNLTRYVCASHYAQIMGPVGAKQVGLPDAMQSARTTQPTDAMLPCPFCGSNLEPYETGDGKTYFRHPRTWKCPADPLLIHSNETEAWNTRTPPPCAGDDVERAARALIADVRRRYPGEELRCPLMIALDNAIAALGTTPSIVVEQPARKRPGEFTGQAYRENL